MGAASQVSIPNARLTHRLARGSDVTSIRALMDAAITELQRPYLDAAQLEASRAIMGLDTQLIDDGTYFLVMVDGQIAGCGGWSRRATLYGGDHSPGRSADLLDPATDAARVRAMYTHPRDVRKGVGRRVLELCESAAAAEGFRRVELMATLAGEPLYRACGYIEIERLSDNKGGAAVPLVRMGKSLADATPGPALRIEIDEPRNCDAFVRLNEQWIVEHFSIEEADRRLAANPFRIVEEGGHILALLKGGRVAGVCALVREGANGFQLARMAVDPRERGQGYGDALMRAAVEQARKAGAQRVYLLSNTVLTAAIALYRKHGFQVLSEGPHPVYARCNIVMELRVR